MAVHSHTPIGRSTLALYDYATLGGGVIAIVGGSVAVLAQAAQPAAVAPSVGTAGVAGVVAGIVGSLCAFLGPLARVWIKAWREDRKERHELEMAREARHNFAAEVNGLKLQGQVHQEKIDRLERAGRIRSNQLAKLREVTVINREWISRVSLEHSEPLPAGFGRRPWDLDEGWWDEPSDEHVLPPGSRDDLPKAKAE